MVYGPARDLFFLRKSTQPHILIPGKIHIYAMFEDSAYINRKKSWFMVPLETSSFFGNPPSPT
jgi:hypothetical protein